MEVGESAAVAVCDTPPDAVLAAELVSVTFKSPVTVSRGRTQVAGPHWERGKELDIEDDWSATAKKMRLPLEPYSKRAAVYLVSGAGSSHEVEIKVRITKNHNVSGRAVLVGALRGLTIEGVCPSSAGEHTVAARIANPPETVQAYRGRIGWALASAGAGITLGLGTTLAEIYFVLGPPKRPFAESGVWVEVLRFIGGRMGAVGSSDAQGIAARITAYCHSGHSLHYETERGRASYGAKRHGGRFNLTGYMLRTQPKCNCYDQAAAIQTFTAALGIELRWLYLSPFGYIKTTRLVGIGWCNNPFFGFDESKKIVAADSPERSAFGNHAFIAESSEGTLDACAGPHVGEETAFQYLSASIDDTPALYDRSFRPGRVHDIVPAQGVISVS
jgi:hypothetical protein